MVFNCETCGSNFQQRRNLRQHQREHHRDASTSGAYCAAPTSTLVETIGTFSLFLLQRALNGYARSYQVSSSDSPLDPAVYFDGTYGLINTLIGTILAEWNHGLKLLLSLHIRFIRATDEDENIRAHFNSSQRIILQGSDIGGELKDGLQQILDRIDKFTQKGSGWTIDKILHLDLNIAKFQVLRGSCGGKKLPAYLLKKKAIVNVKSNDNRCFMWSVLASIYPMDVHSDRHSRYVPFIKNFDFDCISYPVKLKDIPKFETANGISVNIFGVEYDETKKDKPNVYPLYISTKQSAHESDLLLHDGHYSCIKSLDRLLCDQINKEHGKLFCRRCLTHHYSQEALDQHKLGCMRNQPARTVLPADKDKLVKFKNVERMQRSPLTLYADFECILKAMETEKIGSTEESFTQKYQQHVPCGYGLITVLDCGCPGAERKIGMPVVYRGSDAVEQFLDKVVSISNDYAEASQAKLNMSSEDWKTFNAAENCYLCTKQFTEDLYKVKDHCHICGKFRGAAHSKCNIGFRLRRDIPIFFHNLRRYDSHLIMQEIATICHEYDLDIDCIPKGVDDYLCFSVAKFVKNLKRSATEDSADEIQDVQNSE